MSHRAKERLQQQQLSAHIRLPPNPRVIVLTCRWDPSGLCRVMIQRRCNKQNIRSEKENCSDFEKPHKYNPRGSSMIYQEPLGNICRPQSILFFFIDLVDILPGFEGI